MQNYNLADWFLPRNGHSLPASCSGPPAFPEAPCSVNGFFTVPGFARDFQATGRGTTSGEAARNLAATMAATREALAPSPAPGREAHIAVLLAKGLACAAAKKDTALAERLSKAAYLVLSDAVQSTDRPAVMAVRSMTSQDTIYEVTGTVCTCPAWAKAARAGTPQPCKHGLAVAMAARLVNVINSNPRTGASL